MDGIDFHSYSHHDITLDFTHSILYFNILNNMMCKFIILRSEATYWPLLYLSNTYRLLMTCMITGLSLYGNAELIHQRLNTGWWGHWTQEVVKTRWWHMNHSEGKSWQPSWAVTGIDQCDSWYSVPASQSYKCCSPSLGMSHHLPA